MSASPAGPSPERFFDTVNAYQRSAAMKTAIELGLFTAIAEGHNSADKIAARCRIAPRGARILADFLAILGFLQKSSASPPIYTLAEDAALFLDRNSQAYIGTAVEFLSSTHIHAHFDSLPDRVRNGGAPLTGDNSLAPSHDMWVRFARGMAGLMMMPAQMLAQQILGQCRNAAEPAAQPLKILDIAAGHGMFGIAFLQQNPNATVVAQDWQIVLNVALEHARKFNVAGRYAALPGSAFDVPFGNDFDIVLIPNFLHHFTAEENTTLLKKIHAALKPGGIAATLEFAPDDSRLNPPGAGAFALVMLVSTPAGDAYTLSELATMYATAGFKNVQSNMQPLGMQRVITGMK